MATVEDVKRQRDLALKAWRQELQRLADLQKWLQERQEKAAIELEKQRDVVTEARARYESSNEVYLNRLASSGHRHAVSDPDDPVVTQRGRVLFGGFRQ
jgi:hypothetical protein